MAASLNPYISKFDAGFGAEKSAQYKMTIQLALGGLSFALLDTETNRVIALESYQSDLLADSNDLFRLLEKALESKDLNDKPFHSVTCIIDERINILVPEPLFSPEDQEKLINFGFNLPDGYTTETEKLKVINGYNLFALSETLKDKMLSKWPSAQFTHSSTVFLESLPKNEKSSVYVNMRNRNFDMAILKDGNLLFYNNFRFNTKDDCAYFLLFAMEQNGLSGQDTPVQFSGLILPASEIVDLCERYIRDIHFIENPQTLQVSEALNEVPFQYYFIHYQELGRKTTKQGTRVQ